MASNTGCTSDGEPAMTLRISAVAVWRSSAFRVSSNRRAFCSATVAWRDRPTRNSSSRSSNGWPPLRHTAIAPSTWAPARSGTTISRSSARRGVPAICTARGSAAVSLISCASPLCSRLPMMPTPASITVALIASAASPTATIAR